MRLKHDLHEYIAVYIYDLAIAVHDSDKTISLLEGKYKFKLKGTEDITYHLGIDFPCDKYDVLCIPPKNYIEKMCESFERIFGHSPREKKQQNTYWKE